MIAAVGLNAVMLRRGKRYPTDPRIWVAIVLVGIGNASLPYWLIGLSEQIITSSLASVIQATVPLFSLVIAHFMLADERITPPKIAGLVLGFIGVSVLALRQGSLSGEMTGVLLMVLGSFFYGLFAVFNRRTPVEPR
ncbi:MAG: EamA family transporter [Chloroflexi bacterium]|nr:EamA family transporter [Chloroflexota bacterium]